jgi:phosphoribosylformylglycinamidine cyclo-ligase
MTSYREAGVDTKAAARAVEMIGRLASGATREEVVGEIGAFSGLFRISQGRLLAASTDGVGTKLEVARQAGRLTTVGIDLVAMCADDVVCVGAEPLFFLDYLSVGKLVAERVAQIVEGVASGCRVAGCALVGGETAEHPGVMAEDAFDLAGFCVGVVDEASLLGPHLVREGDVLVGLSSSGLHSNGYSMVRSALSGLALDQVPAGLDRPLVDELLEPCFIYAPDVLALAKAGLVRAAAHITGGGFHENIPRALPEGLGADIQRGSWTEHPVFSLIQRESGAVDSEMFATFNMGIGLVLVVGPDRLDELLERGAPACGAVVSVIGSVGSGAGVRIG